MKLPRRRTRCVYCGRRIAGAALSEADTAQNRLPEFQYAARLTCPDHRTLPMRDPFYSYELERAR